jgi:hypothetical protein
MFAADDGVVGALFAALNSVGEAGGHKVRPYSNLD